MPLYKISMRYPPFDRDRTKPEILDAVDCVVSCDLEQPGKIQIGDISGWHAHMTPIENDYSGPVKELKFSKTPNDKIISTRRGWFIRPNSLHRFSRKFLPFGVIAIFSALTLQALFGDDLARIPHFGKFLRTPITLGPLDYPAVLFIAFPLFIIPIILRNVSNLRDIRMQRMLQNSPLGPLDIAIVSIQDAIEFEILNCPDAFRPTQARVVVGMLVPERDVILDAVDRDLDGQPPPGLSTPTPVNVVALGEYDGSSVGESVPMALDPSGNLLLEPLRVSDSGPWVALDAGDKAVTLPVPDTKWPGSIYSTLFSIHWEIQIIGKREPVQSHVQNLDLDIDLGWSQEIIMPEREGDVIISNMPLSAVRELDPLGIWPDSN